MKKIAIWATALALLGASPAIVVPTTASAETVKVVIGNAPHYNRYVPRHKRYAPSKKVVVNVVRRGRNCTTRVKTTTKYVHGRKVVSRVAVRSCR